MILPSLSALTAGFFGAFILPHFALRGNRFAQKGRNLL
jgi:hypothetical protein